MAPLTISNGYTSAHAVLSGRLFVIGGSNQKSSFIKSVECYDPSTDEWEIVAPMRHQRQSAAACALNGFIYVFGGQDGEILLKSIERYDPREDSWTEAS